MKRKSNPKKARKSGNCDADSDSSEVLHEENEDDRNQVSSDKKARRSKSKASKSKKTEEPKVTDSSAASTANASDAELNTEIENDKNEPPEKKTKRLKNKSDPLEISVEAGESNGNDFVETLLEKKTSTKKSSKSSKKKSKSNSKTRESEVEVTDPPDDSNDTEYEVEAILDDKMIAGVHHFLIRWKGYTEESDTWEPENSLSCKQIIKEYKKGMKKKNKKEGKETNHKKDTERSNRKQEKSKKISAETVSAEWDENEDFEVDRILDVYFHKDGKKDFLVSWKGYPASENSWEPEDNMDCKDLIKKFMDKVEEAKKFESKETKLRSNRKPVNRLEFSMHENSRRLSKRHKGTDRVRYYDAE